MGILIKDMEMPRNDEILFLKIYPDGKVAIDGDLECKQIATAVPVPLIVRCKNCKYCDKVDDYEWWCDGRGFPRGLVTSDGFCDKGKEKE